MATDMDKVQKFEDGLKLSIRGKIIEFLLQDMDWMVRTSLAIEKEVDDARSIRDASASGERKEDQPSSSFWKEAEDFYPTSVSRTDSCHSRCYESTKFIT